MAICSATCKDGGACRSKAKPGFTVCGKHTSQGGPVVVVECGHVLTNGNLCEKARGEGEHHCPYHTRILRNREERRNAQQVMVDVFNLLWTDNNVEGALAYLTAAHNDGRMTDRFFVESVPVLEEEIAFYRVINAPRNVAPKGELHALALDNQSVHTGVVNKQTEAGLELLLETPLPLGQDTLAEIESVWFGKSLKPVIRDMKKWYKTKTCRSDCDYLYMHTLNSLWARIKLSPAKSDLVQRLWEECYESVGMCCDGHIARLCNVMCGFDDAFKAPVSVGELLQQKMGMIADMEIHVHQKVGEAWAVFEELAIPMDQRMAWLEAF